MIKPFDLLKYANQAHALLNEAMRNGNPEATERWAEEYKLRMIGCAKAVKQHNDDMTIAANMHPSLRQSYLIAQRRV